MKSKSGRKVDGLEIRRPELSRAERETARAATVILRQIKILSPREQVTEQASKLCCDDLTILNRYYHCNIEGLANQILLDKIAGK